MKVMDHPAGTPCWFDLASDDHEQAKRFYSGLFGWEFSPSSREFNHYSTASLGDVETAGILQRPKDAVAPASWAVYFATTDIARSIEKVTAAGGGVLLPPLHVEPAGDMAICRDAGGAAFGLWQPQMHRGFGSIGTPGSMAWCEVNTRDASAVKDFYEAVLGLKGERMDAPGMHYYTLGDGRPRCGILQMTEEWGDMPPHWMVYFAVEDTDASAQKAKALGGEVAHGPFDTPFGRMAVLKDAGGVPFSIVKPVPTS